jgi:small subunit ribosomal protein S24e
MEIEINEKKNNPLFNRTEVYFTINHEGEGTPNREIIRSEIADKLNVKKENIIINNIYSSFGVQKSKGYAKIYTNPKKAESLERKYILKRNKMGVKEKKKEEDKKESIKESIEEESPKEEDKKGEAVDKVEKQDAKDDDIKSETKNTEEKKE